MCPSRLPEICLLAHLIHTSVRGYHIPYPVGVKEWTTKVCLMCPPYLIHPQHRLILLSQTLAPHEASPFPGSVHGWM